MSTVRVMLRDQNGNKHERMVEGVPDTLTQDEFLQGLPDRIEPGMEVLEVEKMGGQPVVVNPKSKGMTPAEIKDELLAVADTSARGMLAVPGMAADFLTKPMRAVLEEIPGNEKFPAPSEMINKGVNSAIGEPRIPQTVPGKFAAAAGAGATGGTLGMGRAATNLRNAKIGAGGGVGGEMLASLTNSDNPILRVAGAILGSITTAGLTRNPADVSKNVKGVVDALKTSVVGSNPKARGFGGKTLADNLAVNAETQKKGTEFAKKITDAIEYTEKTKKSYGVDMTLNQALREPTDADAIANVLAGSQKAPKTTSVLRHQPDQLSIAATLEQAKNPADVLHPHAMANKVQSGATSVFENIRGIARKEFMKYNPEKSKLPQEAGKKLYSRLTALAKKAPNTNSEGAILAARDQLIRSRQAGSPQSMAGIYEGIDDSVPNTTEFLDDVLTAREAFENGIDNFTSNTLKTTSLDRKTIARVNEARDVFTNIIEEYAPNVARANKRYSQIMSELYEPTKKSATGRVAGITGELPDKEAPLATLHSIFKKGTDQSAKGSSDIMTLARDLNKVDKTTFPSAVKSYVSDVFSSTDIDQNFAKNITNKLYKTPAQKQGFRDMMAGVASSHGMSQSKVVPAAERFMKVFQDVGRANTNPKGMTGAEFAQLAKENTFSSFMRLMGMGWMAKGTIAVNREREVFEQTMKKLDDLFTTKEGMETMIKIANTNLPPQKKMDALKVFVSGAVQGKLNTERR